MANELAQWLVIGALVIQWLILSSAFHKLVETLKLFFRYKDIEK